MLTRRDVATLTWYGLLFSAIVLWASLRPSAPRESSRATTLPSSTEPLEDVEKIPEMRHIVQRMIR
jgi:hypothetical protein